MCSLFCDLQLTRFPPQRPYCLESFHTLLRRLGGGEGSTNHYLGIFPIHLTFFQYFMKLWAPGLPKSQVRTLSTFQNRGVAWIVDQRIVLYTRQNLNQCGLMSINQMKSFKVILINESTSDRQAREAGRKPFNKWTCEYEL